MKTFITIALTITLAIGNIQAEETEKEECERYEFKKDGFYIDGEKTMIMEKKKDDKNINCKNLSKIKGWEKIKEPKERTKKREEWQKQRERR